MSIATTATQATAPLTTAILSSLNQILQILNGLVASLASMSNVSNAMPELLNDITAAQGKLANAQQLTSSKQAAMQANLENIQSTMQSYGTTINTILAQQTQLIICLQNQEQALQSSATAAMTPPSSPTSSN